MVSSPEISLTEWYSITPLMMMVVVVLAVHLTGHDTQVENYTHGWEVSGLE